MTSGLVGTPSDDVPAVLATGRSPATTLFLSMSARDPEGRDADYLRWHTFDHRVEQYRLQSVRASLRLVSTPACRAGRAASEGRYDQVDHVMTYFFSDVSGMKEFNDLAVALGGAGRIPYLLPLVERGVYRVDGRAAASRVKIGADVLPWGALQGAYLVIDQAEAPAPPLTEVPGVAGTWSGEGVDAAPDMPTADGRPMSWSAGLRLTYAFLDDDPVVTAKRVGDALHQPGAQPLLAAPFYLVSGSDVDRHLP